MKKILAFILSVSCLGCIETQDSSRTGIVTHFGKQGLFCKTWEGTMSVGFTSNGTGTVSKEDFSFTVEAPEMIEKIQKAMESGKPVKILYKKELMTFCRSESNDHFAYSIEMLDKINELPMNRLSLNPAMDKTNAK